MAEFKELSVEQQVSAALRLDKRVTEASVAKRVAAIRGQQNRMVEAYAGGLPREQQSKAVAGKAARLQAKRLMLSRKGRKINLAALLNMRREDGKPVWTVADPMHAADQPWKVDGRIFKKSGYGGRIQIGGEDREIVGLKEPPTELRPVGGIPPLPATARKLATDPKIRKRAAWVGLLYQPDEWLEVNPDPAIVVEWKDLPGEYYCLCCWGVDGPAIMEFVS